VATAVRFLDNAIDVSRYPLPAQRTEAQNKRRIGLGVTGLADALIFCGVRYGTEEAARLAGRWMEAIETAAYRASSAIAAEKGAFPLFDAERYLAAPNIARLPADIREAIRKTGIRNGLLTSIAPTGTISLLAHNVSSGVEPVFDFVHRRRVTNADGSFREETVENYAHAVYRAMFGPDVPLTPAFVTAADLSPGQHLDMQAALQRHVDSSISKTINCPVDISFEDFKDVYLRAYDRGLKGCTTYRPNAVTGSILQSGTAPAQVARTGEVVQPTAAVALPAERDDGVIYMADPLERDSVLSGATYKLKWQGSDHALYITINDIERDGRRRPFEIFINSKNLEHYAWTVALTRMISAVFRRGGDVSFVVEELKAIFDPQGGQWSNGRYVPSLIAAIGEVIEGHMRSTGFLRSQEATAAIPAKTALRDGGASPTGGGAIPRGRTCPRCGTFPLLKREGCWVCSNCDYSKCG
jgi:ribonucleoside-diphosphate reductase alpha chain